MSVLVDARIPASARVLVTLGVILGAVFAAMLVFFIGGEMLADPGGVQGLLFVCAWLVLPAALSILALVQPGVASTVLTVTSALVVLASLVAIPLAREVWEFEDTHGPINLVVLIGALIPLVALGRARPERAGWLLIATIAGSVILQGISLGLVGEWSVIPVFVVVTAPFIAVAVLFVIGGARARRDSNPQPTG